MDCKYLNHQICIRSDGQYRLCCVSSEPDNRENIFTTTPYQWQNSDFHKFTRQQLQNDVWPSSCDKCKDLENKGLISQRLKPEPYGPGLSHLDLRFGNSCNLKCISCWSGSSSSIAEEAIQMHKKGEYRVHPNYNLENFNWANEFILNKLDLSEVKEIYLTGGEPMMVKHLPEFLQKLDKNIRLRFNTNCTIWNPKIEKLLRKFDHVSMALSLDAVDSRIDYIRYGSNWGLIEENVKRYAEFCAVDITPTVSVLNAAFIDDIKEYADKNNFGYYENILMNPQWLNCKNAPPALKKLYISDSIKQWADHEPDEKYISEFKTKIKILDEWRNIKIGEYLPEVAEAYGIN